MRLWEYWFYFYSIFIIWLFCELIQGLQRWVLLFWKRKIRKFAFLNMVWFLHHRKFHCQKNCCLLLRIWMSWLICINRRLLGLKNYFLFEMWLMELMWHMREVLFCIHSHHVELFFKNIHHCRWNRGLREVEMRKNLKFSARSPWFVDFKKFQNQMMRLMPLQ